MRQNFSATGSAFDRVRIAVAGHAGHALRRRATEDPCQHVAAHGPPTEKFGPCRAPHAGPTYQHSDFKPKPKPAFLSRDPRFVSLPPPFLFLPIYQQHCSPAPPLQRLTFASGTQRNRRTGNTRSPPSPPVCPAVGARRLRACSSSPWRWSREEEDEA